MVGSRACHPSAVSLCRGGWQRAQRRQVPGTRSACRSPRAIPSLLHEMGAAAGGTVPCLSVGAWTERSPTSQQAGGRLEGATGEGFPTPSSLGSPRGGVADHPGPTRAENGKRGWHPAVCNDRRRPRPTSKLPAAAAASNSCIHHSAPGQAPQSVPSRPSIAEAHARGTEAGRLCSRRESNPDPHSPFARHRTPDPTLLTDGLDATRCNPSIVCGTGTAANTTLARISCAAVILARRQHRDRGLTSLPLTPSSAGCRGDSASN